jgi:hypothetical protein
MSNSRVDTLRAVDPVLSTIAQSYSNSSFMSELLFPKVSVSKLKGKIPRFGKEAFYLREINRAIGASSNRIPPADVELIDFETNERDVEMAIDYLEQEESSFYRRYESQVTKQLVDTIALKKEKEAADLVQNTANYSSGMFENIVSGDAFNNYSLNKDPILKIRDGISAIRAKIGRYPNTMLIGEATYKALIDHPKILERIEFNGIKKANAQIIGDICDIPNVGVGLAVSTDNGTTFSDIWEDNIILAYVDKSEKKSEFIPSFGYTFQREGMPQIDTYFENGGKIKIIRNTDNYALKITANDAGYLIKNTNH